MHFKCYSDSTNLLNYICVVLTDLSVFTNEVLFWMFLISNGGNHHATGSKMLRNWTLVQMEKELPAYLEPFFNETL